MNILKSYSDLSVKHGIISPENLAKYASEDGFNSIALTDYMNMFGFLRFYSSCIKLKVKPILGVELLIRHKEIGDYKILAYAKNNLGLKNLFNILSLSYTKYSIEDSKNVPHLPHEFLNLYNVKNIIFTNGGVDGYFGVSLKLDKENLISEIYSEYEKLTDDYYLELNRFSTDVFYSKEFVNRYNDIVINYYKTYKSKFIFTNPILFRSIDDYDSHLIRVSAGRAIPINSDLFNDNVRDYYSTNMFFLNKDNLKELNQDILEVESKFSDDLVNSIDVTVETGKNYLPKFNTPNGETEEDYFKSLSNNGLLKRLKNNNIDKSKHCVYIDRLNFEINVIVNMGFIGYFLIVQDFIKWSKENDIPVGPGRGSGAGSLVAYSLEITDLDPLPYDLLFERFLNPDRVSMPDFDIDFCQERRGEVIHYVQNKYGVEAVSQIMTTGTMASRSVIKDVARALGKPIGLANSMSNKVDPMLDGLMESYNDINNTQNGLMELIKGDDDAAQVWEHALKLEGVTKSVGKHAAGVLIAPNKIIDFCPLYQVQVGDLPVSQLDKDDVEAVGLVKFDFLGLRNLTIIQNTLKMLKVNKGLDFKFTEDFTDEKTYELLQKGNVTGVFQVEGGGIRNALMKLKPTCFEDIIAILALYRPGPLGSGMVESFIKRKAWERDGKISRVDFFENKFSQYCNNFNKSYSKDNNGRKVSEYEMEKSKWINDHSSLFDGVYEIPNYYTKDLEECLKPTYGVIVYQEQVMKISQIIAGYSLGQADLLRRCISGDSNVTLRNGDVVKVKDMYDNKNYYINKNITSINEVTKKNEVDYISNIYYNGYKLTYRVKTKSGKEIMVTNDHLFYTIDGWKMLNTLKSGSFIATSKLNEIDNNVKHDLSLDKIKIIAYILGDGCISGKNCYFCNSDKELIDDFIKSYKNLFGDSFNIRVQTKQGLKSVTYIHLNKDGKIWINAVLGNKKSDNKFIPKEIFKLNNEELKVFIGTLWNTDGSFDKSIGHCDYNSKSKDFIEQLNSLLLRFNIVAKKEVRVLKYNNDFFYRCQITGKIDYVKFYNTFYSHLSLKNKKYAEICFELINKKIENGSKHCMPNDILKHILKSKYNTGLSWNKLGLEGLISGLNLKTPNGKRKINLSKFKKIAQKLNDNELTYLADSDIFWDEIISIEEYKFEDVYDLEINSNHNFYANDILVHNCMGKKKPEEMAKQRSVFLDGANKLGYSEDLSMNLFDLMESFAEYGFNKSHSAAYAVLTYQTAYLKTHYPSEFLAATLQSEKNDTNKLSILIKDCYKNNLMVVPPSINYSYDEFSVNSKGQIVYGLSGLKRISSESIKEVLEERSLNGKFKDINDFIQRNVFSLSKGMLESLVYSGSFDCFNININRGSYSNALSNILEQKRKIMTKSKKIELFFKDDVIKEFKVREDFTNDEFNLTDYEMSQKEKLFIGFELVHSAYEALIKNIDEIRIDYNLPNDIMILSPTSLMNSIKHFKSNQIQVLLAGELIQTPHFEDARIKLLIKDLKTEISCWLDKGFEMMWFKKHKEMLLEGRVVYFKATIHTKQSSFNELILDKIEVIEFIDLAEPK